MGASSAVASGTGWQGNDALPASCKAMELNILASWGASYQSLIECVYWVNCLA